MKGKIEGSHSVELPVIVDPFGNEYVAWVGAYTAIRPVHLQQFEIILGGRLVNFYGLPDGWGYGTPRVPSQEEAAAYFTALTGVGIFSLSLSPQVHLPIDPLFSRGEDRIPEFWKTPREQFEEDREKLYRPIDLNEKSETSLEPDSRPLAE